MVKAHCTVASGAICVESRATGCKVEVVLDSCGTVLERGEEGRLKLLVLPGASLGHADTDT